MAEKPPPPARPSPRPSIEQPEPPLPDAPPPWLAQDPGFVPTNQVTAAAAAAGASTGYLRPVPPQPESEEALRPPPERPLRSNSYLAIYKILSRPELRARFLGAKKIELNEMGEQVEIGRQPITGRDLSWVRAMVEAYWTGDKKGGGMRFSKRDVEEALHHVAYENRYHPVQEYLRGLTWDRVPRLDLVAAELLDVTNPTPIVQTMVRKWFVSAVKRAMEPGCKSKSMLILQGYQDAAKSEWFKVLASPEWFNDTPIDIHNKEAHVVLSSVWIQEWAELREMQGRTAEAVKAFISSSEGKFLPKFSNIMTKKKRTSVIVGTTNELRFLDDPSGNVRYHPVAVGKEINLDGTAAQRDQLWAEAFAIWQRRERFDSWLTTEEGQALAEVQKQFEQVDAWEDAIADFADRYIGPLTTHVLFDEVLRIPLDKRHKHETQRVANIMRRLGYREGRLTEVGADGKRRRPHGWIR